MTRTASLALLSLLLAAPLAAVSPEREGRVPPPASLAGTEPDGGLTVDASGRFVADAEAVRLFDYFLTATGEEPAGVIQARIEREARQRLEPAAAEEALAFLDRYLDYRDRARALPQAPSLEEGFASLAALRREVFGEEVAEAAFGADEELGRATLAARGSADPKAASRTLAQVLSNQARSGHDDALAPTASLEAEQALSAPERAAAREATFGPEAAARLAALDAEQAAFRTRLDAYRAARRAVEADGTLDAAAKGAAIEALLTARFAGPEAVRVRALDRIEGVSTE